jgi:iron complex transport system substrate-binding protein
MVVGRRALLAGVMGSVASVALTACGSGEDTARGGAASGPSGTAQGTFPRTVKHEVGETAVPAPPQRIVAATDGGELCSLVALGLQPVGFGQRNKPLRPWLAGRTGSAQTFDLPNSEMSFERLAAWRPDLLLVQNGFATAENLGKYSAIAPTVVTSFEDWRANLRQVGEAVGRAEDAKRVEKAADDQVAAAKTRFARFAGLKVRVATAFDDGSVYVLNEQSPIGKLATALGLAPFPAQVTDGEAINPVSLEQLTVIDGDLLLIQHFGDGDGAPGLKQRDVYKRLSAVGAGKVVDLTEDESNASYFDTVLTIPLNLAMLEKHLPASGR